MLKLINTLKLMSFPLTQGSLIVKNLSPKFHKFGPSNIKLHVSVSALNKQTIETPVTTRKVA